MPTEVAIHLHASSGPDFITSDAPCVAGIRAALGSSDRHLVPVRQLATILRNNGRALWAMTLDRLEEPSVVTVVFG